MSGEDRLLCVGGPADGQYVNIATDKRSVVVASFNPPTPNYLVNIDVYKDVYSDDQLPIRETWYVRRRLVCERADSAYDAAAIHVLVPFGTDCIKTLDNLLTSYADRSNDK